MRRQIIIGCSFIALLWPFHGLAEVINNKVAVFAALDKVTARVQPLKVRINETITFGSLRITPRACHTRSSLETPVTAAFVEVEETQLNNEKKQIFSGWMFAENPGIHGVEHPVLDVWLTSCKMPVAGKRRGSSWKPAENP